MNVSFLLWVWLATSLLLLRDLWWSLLVIQKLLTSKHCWHTISKEDSVSPAGRLTMQHYKLFYASRLPENLESFTCEFPDSLLLHSCCQHLITCNSCPTKHILCFLYGGWTNWTDAKLGRSKQQSCWCTTMMECVIYCFMELFDKLVDYEQSIQDNHSCAHINMLKILITKVVTHLSMKQVRKKSQAWTNHK